MTNETCWFRWKNSRFLEAFSDKRGGFVLNFIKAIEKSGLEGKKRRKTVPKTRMFVTWESDWCLPPAITCNWKILTFFSLRGLSLLTKRHLPPHYWGIKKNKQRKNTVNKLHFRVRRRSETSPMRALQCQEEFKKKSTSQNSRRSASHRTS